jgi:hypothetical protein
MGIGKRPGRIRHDVVPKARVPLPEYFCSQRIKFGHRETRESVSGFRCCPPGSVITIKLQLVTFEVLGNTVISTSFVCVWFFMERTVAIVPEDNFFVLSILLPGLTLRRLFATAPYSLTSKHQPHDRATMAPGPHDG